MTNINGEVVGNLFRSTQQLAAFEAFLAQMAQQASTTGGGAEESTPPRREREVEEEPEAPADPARDGPRLIIPQRTPAAKPSKFQNVGRNDACPCGSGKKYKQCCGRTA
jgi:preprotein translocase subunit SecA